MLDVGDEIPIEEATWTAYDEQCWQEYCELEGEIDWAISVANNRLPLDQMELMAQKITLIFEATDKDSEIHPTNVNCIAFHVSEALEDILNKKPMYEIVTHLNRIVNDIEEALERTSNGRS